MSPVTFDPRAFERKPRMSLAEVRANLCVAADKARPWAADVASFVCVFAFVVVGCFAMGYLGWAVGGHVQ